MTVISLHRLCKLCQKTFIGWLDIFKWNIFICIRQFISSSGTGLYSHPVRYISFMTSYKFGSCLKYTFIAHIRNTNTYQTTGDTEQIETHQAYLLTAYLIGVTTSLVKTRNFKKQTG